MNLLYYGVLWIFFLINFIISAEMTSFSLDDEGYVDLVNEKATHLALV